LLTGVRSYSFTKADRLSKRAEFLHVSEIGKTVHDRDFIAVFAQGRHDRTRLGVTVSKKVGKSVTRSRVKRLIREFFRHHRHFIAGNRDICIIAKKRAADLSSADAFLSLKHLFEKVSRADYQTNIPDID
jgi:ribonuclease P protein component